MSCCCRTVALIPAEGGGTAQAQATLVGSLAWPGPCSWAATEAPGRRPGLAVSLPIAPRGPPVLPSCPCQLPGASRMQTRQAGMDGSSCLPGNQRPWGDSQPHSDEPRHRDQPGRLTGWVPWGCGSAAVAVDWGEETCECPACQTQLLSRRMRVGPCRTWHHGSWAL